MITSNSKFVIQNYNYLSFIFHTSTFAFLIKHYHLGEYSAYLMWFICLIFDIESTSHIPLFRNNNRS